MEAPIPQISSPVQDRKFVDQQKKFVLEHHVEVLPKSSDPLEKSQTQDSHANPLVKMTSSPKKNKVYRPERKAPISSKPAKTKPINQRPPWVGIGTSTSAMNGADIPPPLGRSVRYQNNRQQHHDQHFLQTLRVSDDPNVSWREQKVKRKMRRSRSSSSDADLPPVFLRLTDPANYPASHSRRFNPDGTGAGLEGRRDDTDIQVNINGQAQILRDDDPEMDSPHKPIMSWEEDKLRSDAYYSADMDQSFRSEDAFEDKTMTHGVHGRLSSSASVPEHKSKESEYEKMQSVRKDFKVDSCHAFKWQAFTDEIGN